MVRGGFCPYECRKSARQCLSGAFWSQPGPVWPLPQPVGNHNQHHDSTRPADSSTSANWPPKPTWSRSPRAAHRQLVLGRVETGAVQDFSYALERLARVLEPISPFKFIHPPARAGCAWLFRSAWCRSAKGTSRESARHCAPPVVRPWAAPDRHRRGAVEGAPGNRAAG